MPGTMCRLDYAMTEAGRSAEFVREYTLAAGGHGKLAACAFMVFNKQLITLDPDGV